MSTLYRSGLRRFNYITGSYCTTGTRMHSSSLYTILKGWHSTVCMLVLYSIYIPGTSTPAPTTRKPVHWSSGVGSSREYSSILYSRCAMCSIFSHSIAKLLRVSETVLSVVAHHEHTKPRHDLRRLHLCTNRNHSAASLLHHIFKQECSS